VVIVSKTPKTTPAPKSTCGPEVRCTVCNTVIQSKHRHDFVWCKCNKENRDAGIFVDGGSDYLRFGGDISRAEILVGGSHWVPLTKHFRTREEITAEESQPTEQLRSEPSTLARALSVEIFGSISAANDTSDPKKAIALVIDDFLSEWNKRNPR